MQPAQHKTNNFHFFHEKSCIKSGRFPAKIKKKKPILRAHFFGVFVKKEEIKNQFPFFLK